MRLHPVAALHLAYVLLLGLAPVHTYAQEATPLAYRSAALAHGVPSNILFAVALAESGAVLGGRPIPWPWTLNIAGRSFRFANRIDACDALRNAIKNQVPSTRIDVGLGQINLGFNGHRLAGDPCALLDPYQNLALTALILREHYALTEDWTIAIGRYHRPAGGELAKRYVQTVQHHLRRVTGMTAWPPQ